MWDKPTLLNWIANLLFALSVVVMLYAALYAVVLLPIFPLREVNFSRNQFQKNEHPRMLFLKFPAFA